MVLLTVVCFSEEMDDFSDSNLRIYEGDSHKKSNSRILIGAILVLAVGIGLGVIIGWFSHTYDEPKPAPPPSKCDFGELVNDENTTILEIIKAKMSAANIDANLR